MRVSACAADLCVRLCREAALPHCLRVGTEPPTCGFPQPRQSARTRLALGRRHRPSAWRSSKGKRRPDWRCVVAEDLSALDLTNGFVSPVLKVDGVRDLERLLSCWVNESDEPTVGDLPA